MRTVRARATALRRLDETGFSAFTSTQWSDAAESVLSDRFTRPWCIRIGRRGVAGLGAVVTFGFMLHAGSRSKPSRARAARAPARGLREEGAPVRAPAHGVSSDTIELIGRVARQNRRWSPRPASRPLFGDRASFAPTPTAEGRFHNNSPDRWSVLFVRFHEELGPVSPSARGTGCRYESFGTGSLISISSRCALRRLRRRRFFGWQRGKRCQRGTSRKRWQGRCGGHRCGAGWRRQIRDWRSNLWEWRRWGWQRGCRKRRASKRWNRLDCGGWGPGRRRRSGRSNQLGWPELHGGCRKRRQRRHERRTNRRGRSLVWNRQRAALVWTGRGHGHLEPAAFSGGRGPLQS